MRDVNAELYGPSAVWPVDVQARCPGFIHRPRADEERFVRDMSRGAEVLVFSSLEHFGLQRWLWDRTPFNAGRTD